jgi:hypothetical protein
MTENTDTNAKLQLINNPAFTFYSPVDERELFRITKDGKVIRNPNVSWDECAEAFWAAVDSMRANS